MSECWSCSFFVSRLYVWSMHVERDVHRGEEEVEEEEAEEE